MIEILTVCTGNVCRSALAGVVLRGQLADLGVRVSSAGVGALVGDPLTPQTAQLALAAGARQEDVAGHRARYLSEGIAVQADLVLAMTRDHRRAVVELTPALLRRAFTVREFARLAEGMADSDIIQAAVGGSPQQCLRAALRVLATRRGIVGPAEDPGLDDVIDPYLQSDAVYQRQAGQLLPALDQVERFVRAAVGQGKPSA
ncbi:arsenate reductase/protein-tyrosine-phosphatase family protein [Nesterenkonia ebinurensis]|uniref:arsenate reductase/protein-tyrosine-phosphatase family protein n=1 Tax=Nesterenkonia ebinurensis TaxID=2608252 RepID=UPI00123DDBB7|nr:low molecular weight phosphatase family protein [Nesterenkonia ebinurensis]